MKPLPASIDATLDLLAKAGYIADRSLATVLYLALKMGRPLFVEGEAGTGKTEIAKVLSQTLGRKLIRLQCYEGLDVAAAVYEWNYGAQMIAIRLAEAEGEGDRERIEHDVFSERFLIKRPLLQALEPDADGPPVLLIDEIDRTDEAFEAFLLEVLADFQVTVPELGTIKAPHPPIVLITSNRTREVHDALKRRCLYHWVGYPECRARTENPARQGAGRVQETVRAGGRLCAELAQGGPVQGAGRRRDAGLGRRAHRARRGGARSGHGFRHARRAAQISGRHRSPRRHQGEGAARRGEVGAEGGGVIVMAEGRLAENILYFARALRAAGMPVGPGAVLDALQALQVAHVGDREDFYWTLHAVFVKRHEHTILFDQAFRIFFRKRGYIEKLIASMLPETAASAPKPPAPGAQRVQEALFSGLKREEEKSEIEIDARLTVSDREVLQKKDFAQMTAAEIAAAKDAIARLALPLDLVRTRRTVASRRGHLIDIRRTLRASMKAGGAVIDLKYLGPRVKEPPIVALLDISGSMSQYTRLFLHFLHSITDARKRVTTFLFGTRLTNVTRSIRQRDPDEALAACSVNVSDWSGGTRIASSLRVFNKDWSRRVLGQGAVVLLDHRRARARRRRHAGLRDGPAAPLLPAVDLAQPALTL